MPRLIYDWSLIQEYHNLGHGFVECQRHFGVTHTAWNKAIATGRLLTASRPFQDRRRRYDWQAVQDYYDRGHSYRQCQAEFGFHSQAWEKARKRGDIRTRPRSGMSVEALLLVSRSRLSIKRKLLRAGLLQNICEVCGISEWLGKSLSCHIDHINGVRDDHRLENLRTLCPNCHSQTATYGGRNARRRRSLQDLGARV